MTTPYDVGEWTIAQNVHHLADTHLNAYLRFKAILSEDNPTFKAVNPTTWIKQTDYRQQEFQPSLQAFTAQRAELLEHRPAKPQPPGAGQLHLLLRQLVIGRVAPPELASYPVGA